MLKWLDQIKVTKICFLHLLLLFKGSPGKVKSGMWLELPIFSTVLVRALQRRELGGARDVGRESAEGGVTPEVQGQGGHR